MEQQPEEVTRLLEAIKAFAAIEDDAACALAVTKALDEWPDWHATLRKLRQARVNALRDAGMTWDRIGKDALGGKSAARAQQIGAGLRGSKRPAKKDRDAAGE